MLTGIGSYQRDGQRITVNDNKGEPARWVAAPQRVFYPPAAGLKSMNFKAACVFTGIMEVSLSRYQLMTTVNFYEEKCQYHLEFLEREKPVDLPSAAWPPPSL